MAAKKTVLSKDKLQELLWAWVTKMDLSTDFSYRDYVSLEMPKTLANKLRPAIKALPLLEVTVKVHPSDVSKILDDAEGSCMTAATRASIKSAFTK